MSATLVLLPGLGADPRLFEPQKRAFPDLISIPWPDARDDDTLTSYAARIASLLPIADSLVLGGSSFGGMVALEIAAKIQPKAVILIGSCRSPRALAPWLRTAWPFVRGLPDPLFRPRRWAVPLAAPIYGGADAGTLELAWDMVREMSSAFLKWGIRAVFEWQPSPVTVPVRHIHGSVDRLIPANRVEPDRVIQGAGHLLTLTHADAVNAWLVEQMAALGSVPVMETLP